MAGHARLCVARPASIPSIRHDRPDNSYIMSPYIVTIIKSDIMYGAGRGEYHCRPSGPSANGLPAFLDRLEPKSQGVLL